MNSGLIPRLASVARFFRRRHATSGGPPVTEALHQGTVAFWHTEEGWGAVRTPDRPGLGVEMDWDWIDNATQSVRRTPAS